MASLKNKYGDKALVTGASSGIGEHFARQLAEQGFDLLLVARSAPALTTLADELSRKYSVAVAIAVVDLADAEALNGLLATAQRFAPTLVISNAGFGTKGEFLAQDYAEVENMYAANSLAPSKLAYALLPAMVAAKRGGFIFTGSVEGEVAFPYSSAYAASKAFLHSLVRGLWWEMKGHNVDILLLAPGSTDTASPIKQGMTKDQLIGLQSPAFVAEKALSALGHKMVITPGMVNTMYIHFFKLLPRKWSTIVAGLGMKKAIDDAKG